MRSSAPRFLKTERRHLACNADKVSALQFSEKTICVVHTTMNENRSAICKIAYRNGITLYEETRNERSNCDGKGG